MCSRRIITGNFRMSDIPTKRTLIARHDDYAAAENDIARSAIMQKVKDRVATSPLDCPRCPRTLLRHFYYIGGRVAVKNEGINAVEQYGAEKYFKTSTSVSKSV